MVEKSVQHRVVGKTRYTPVATIPTKKVQKNVKVAPPKEGGCGDRGNPKTEPYCLVFQQRCLRHNQSKGSYPWLHGNFMEHFHKYHMADLPGPLQSPVELKPPSVGCFMKNSELCFKRWTMKRIASLSLLLAVMGCSESINQTTYPVQGEVRLDGKPFKGVTVVFRPVDKTNFKRQEIPQGITDENGKYSIHTYTSKDGAPAGEYKVGLAFMQPLDEEGGDQVKRDASQLTFPPKYADPETSGLKATVEKKSSTIPTFELTK